MSKETWLYIADVSRWSSIKFLRIIKILTLVVVDDSELVNDLEKENVSENIIGSEIQASFEDCSS